MRQQPTEAVYETRHGKHRTLAELHGFTQQQPWFQGTFLEWCVAKGFIKNATPVAFRHHIVDKADLERRPGDIRRNSMIDGYLEDE